MHSDALWYGATDEEVIYLHRVSNRGSVLHYMIHSL